jgi:hypothetical protein
MIDATSRLTERVGVTEATVTLRAVERADVGRETREAALACIAAIAAEVSVLGEAVLTVVLGAVVLGAVVLGSYGASGRVIVAVRWTLAEESRRVRRQTGVWQWRAVTRRL